MVWILHTANEHIEDEVATCPYTIKEFDQWTAVVELFAPQSQKPVKIVSSTGSEVSPTIV